MAYIRTTEWFHFHIFLSITNSRNNVEGMVRQYFDGIRYNVVGHKTNNSIRYKEPEYLIINAPASCEMMRGKKYSNEQYKMLVHYHWCDNIPVL